MNHQTRSRGTVATFAVATAAVLVLAGCTPRAATGSDAQSADDSPIVIGASWPQSGPLGSVAPGLAGLEAAIAAANEDGGVDGREIELVTADDAYDPARLVENERKFVEQDGAIAVVNFGGISIAGREYLGQKQVMGVSMAGNSPLSDIEAFPMQRAFWPDVSWEAQLQGKWLTEHAPDAVVGYIGFNNDLTESHLAGLAAQGVTPAQVAAVPPGTADLSAQVSQFQAAGVDTVIINIGAPTGGATLAYMDQIGWKPTVFLSSTVSDFHTVINISGPGPVEGAYSFEFFKDPSDPRYADDDVIAQYLDDMEASGHEKDATNALALEGYGLGAALVDALSRTDSFDSEGLLAAWDSFDGTENPMLRDGITLEESSHGRVIFQYQLSRFDGASWVDEGEIEDVRELGIVE
ncbi:ABC transporter substrate-binding protein [Agromyces sp. CFH 90414]|uniref:ABC transporter substrate-binding protein n=1 Tax=Agromyces agglutinans TaxID=2662258 RepID=A0A6I2F141_9MICO|nr:ABC transporter substrate-binding protein [Agromyces agglutinans]MRG58309.1 ABC transporter substrate-binding protein [Agromyces agglutinans]